MPLNENLHFVDEIIQLDKEEYRHCTFKRCKFIYSGLAPVILDDFEIEDCDLELAGYASNTAMVLGALRKTSLKRDVDRALGIALEQS